MDSDFSTYIEVPEVAYITALFLACLHQVMSTGSAETFISVTCEKRKKFEAHFRDQSMKEVRCCLIPGKLAQTTPFQTYTEKWQKVGLNHICLLHCVNFLHSSYAFSFWVMLWICAGNNVDNRGIFKLLLSSACTQSRTFLPFTPPHQQGGWGCTRNWEETW